VLAPALRVGYMIGRGGPFINAMIQRTSDAGLSAPLITQEISSWLLDYQIGKHSRVSGRDIGQRRARCAPGSTSSLAVNSSP